MSKKQNKGKAKTVEYPPLSRKIVACMTAEAFHETPHAGGCYEPDVTDFWRLYQSLRETEHDWAGISANSLMLRVVVEGLKACPRMNGHSKFNLKTAHGKVTLYDNIDITMPTVLPDGGMMAIKVPGCESASLRGIQNAVDDIRRRLDNTFLDDAMFLLALKNTLQKIENGRVDVTLRRAACHFFGPSRASILWGKAWKRYHDIPKEDRLLWRDFEQGTVMVTNFGSVYRGAYASPMGLDLVPPQICAIGIGGVVEKPGVATGPDGTKEIVPRMFIPFHIIFDHRAIDYAETVPFMKRLDEIFADPSAMKDWI